MSNRKNDRPAPPSPLALAVSMALVALAPDAGAATIRVKHDAVGANNGTSWADAYTNLRTALAAAAAGDEVWVARGTYVPATVADPLARARSFSVKSGVKLYGGFAGAEAARSQRNFVANPTILSGDVIGDDLPGGVNRGDNCVTIVVMYSPSLPTFVDGFIIRGANMLEQGIVHEPGGAIKIVDDSNARITNCVIRDNDGERGAAIGMQLSLSNATAAVVNCLITGNRGQGGCVYAEHFPSLYLSSCTIAGNTAPATTGPAAVELLICTDVQAANNIVWNNSNANGSELDAQFFIDGATIASVTYCDVQGGTVGLGEGCVSVDPCFRDPTGADGVIGTADDDFSLRPASRVIDAGDGTRLPFDLTDTDGDANTAEPLPLDLARAAREHNDPGIFGAAFSPYLDMGAYEFQGASCPGDVDANGVINTADLTRFLGNFGQVVQSCALTDLNADGVVNTNDLVLLLAKFGQACPS